MRCMGAWKALENAVDEGKVRSIGISNFDEARTLNISKKYKVSKKSGRYMRKVSLFVPLIDTNIEPSTTYFQVA